MLQSMAIGVCPVGVHLCALQFSWSGVVPAEVIVKFIVDNHLEDKNDENRWESGEPLVFVRVELVLQADSFDKIK